MGWKMKKSYYSMTLYIQKNHYLHKLITVYLSLPSMSGVSVIVKFCHKVHETCLHDFASEMLFVSLQRGCSFEAIPELQ